ncbi:MAG: thiamine diphosphokinase [Treponema sp.]|nr:thiamine diphosphokinase [Treponema sp.]
MKKYTTFILKRLHTDVYFAGGRLLGIVFTGGECPPPQIITRLIEKDAKGALLVAADSGLMAAARAGLRPDWITGDMDSIDDISRLAAWPPERVIRHQRDKDYTDTELALLLAAEKGCDEVWIIGGGGGRIDHLFGIRSLFEREAFPRRWITEAADIRCIDANAAQRGLSTSLEKGASVSVFPLGAGPWEAGSRGLKWPLEGLPWNRGFFGLSNAAPQGDFIIKAEKGRFMVILPLPVIL